MKPSHQRNLRTQEDDCKGELEQSGNPRREFHTTIKKQIIIV